MINLPKFLKKINIMEKLKEIVDSAPDLGKFYDFGEESSDDENTFLKMNRAGIKYAKVYTILDASRGGCKNRWIWSNQNYHTCRFILITSIESVDKYPIFIETPLRTLITPRREVTLEQLSPAKELFPWKDDLPHEISFNPPFIVNENYNDFMIICTEQQGNPAFNIKITGIVYFDNFKEMIPITYLALGYTYIDFTKENPDASKKKIDDYTFSKYCTSRIIYLVKYGFYLTDDYSRFNNILKRSLPKEFEN